MCAYLDNSYFRDSMKGTGVYFLLVLFQSIKDPFTPNLFGAVQTNSGALSCLVLFVWANLKAVKLTLGQNKHPRLISP